MHNVRSKHLMGALALPLIISIVFLGQGCGEPFGLNDILRDRFTADDDPSLVISDDGSVLASGPVEAVAERSFELAGAEFAVSHATSFLDAEGRSSNLRKVEVGDVLEVDGIQREDGSFEATFAEEVRTSNNAAERVVICHIPPGNPDNARTKTVGENAAAAHLAHGDHEGECTGQESGDGNDDEEDDDEEKVIVCHIPPGNPDNARTLSIGISGLQDHLDHGDYEGECIDQGEQEGG